MFCEQGEVSASATSNKLLEASMSIEIPVSAVKSVTPCTTYELTLIFEGIQATQGIFKSFVSANFILGNYKCRLSMYPSGKIEAQKFCCLYWDKELNPKVDGKMTCQMIKSEVRDASLKVETDLVTSKRTGWGYNGALLTNSLTL